MNPLDRSKRSDGSQKNMKNNFVQNHLHMKYLSIIIFIFISSILFLASCEDCTEIYKTTGMNVRPVNDSIKAAVDTNATVSYENLFIYIVFDWDYEHFCEPGLATETRHLSSIKSLTLTCDQDYSKEYPAGSDLSDIVDISYQEIRGFYNEYSPRMSLNEYINSNENCPPRIRLFLKVPPDFAKQLRFTIDYLEAGGQNLRLTCYPFYITP
jgi:hypothetical protein